MKRFFTKKEYQEIADLFNLGTFKKIVYFGKGYETPKVLLVTPKGKFVVAKHNISHKEKRIVGVKIKPKIALMSEIQFLHALRRLPVPHYILSTRRKYLESFKGYAIGVYQFLSGQPPKKISSKMAEQLGEFVGAFHAQGSKLKKLIKGRRRFYDLNPHVMSLMYTYAKKQNHPQLKAVIEEIKRGVEQTRLPKNLPRGPVHVDIKPDNELFIGETLTGIVDFGNMYVDAFVFDLGKAIMWNCVKKGRLNLELTKHFLQGYFGKRKLNKKESKYLQQAILFAIYSHIWVDLYHVSIKYVPESYVLFLVKIFLPVARWLQKTDINSKYGI